MARWRGRVLQVAACILWMACPALGACRSGVAKGVRSALENGQLDELVIRYSWTEGLGEGDVRLELRGNGTGIFTIRPRDGNVERRERQVPTDRISTIVKRALRGSLFCAKQVPRTRCIADIGRWTVEFELGGESWEAHVDGLERLEHGDDFDALRADLQGFADVFGPELEWGPLAWTAVHCP